MERTAMSRKEFERGVVFERVERGELTVKDAAPLLIHLVLFHPRASVSLDPVSVSQSGVQENRVPYKHAQFSLQSN